MLEKLFKEIDQHYEEFVKIRRYLHERPELSFQEHQTASYIADYYRKLNIPVETKIGGNGVIARLKGKQAGKTIAFRADFDALPIQDEKDVSYKSKVPGVMHACGHDAHTATLLVLAKILQAYREELKGEIVFLHQHAEELPPGGAKPILSSGALDHVDFIFGNHFWSTLPLGTIASREDVFMAGTDRFTINIRGKGGHGAYPEETRDAIVIASQLVSALQTIVSRQISALESGVLTIGKFSAGSAFNIIAEEAQLEGTIRYTSPEAKKKMKEALYQITEGICHSQKASFSIDYADGYPPLVNHPEETTLLFKAVKAIPEVKNIQRSDIQLAAEDFAYYVQEKRGAFFFTGAMKKGNEYPHHHPRFDIDERAMPIAAKAFVSLYETIQTNRV